MARKDQGRLGKYRNMLAESRRWRQAEGYDDLWDRLIDLYATKPFERVSREDRIAVNLAFSTINVIYPSTTVNHPKITLQARKPDDFDKATIAEAVMDFQWKDDDIGAGEEMRLAVKDFLVIGHGWVKTGWRYSTVEQPRPAEDIEADYQTQRAEADAAAEADPSTAHELPTDDDIRAAIPSTQQVAKEDRVFVERVSPFDIYIDPEASTVRNLGWIAHRIVRPLEEAKADPRYDPRVRKNIQADVTTLFGRENDDKRRHRSGNSGANERCTIWEFYDLRKGEMCVFAQLGEGFLVKPTKMPYNIGLPFRMIANYTVPDRFYPIGELEAIEPLVHELNRTRSQLMNARKTYTRKYIADENALSPQARDALTSSTDGEVVLVNTNGGQIPLSNFITPIPATQIPGDLFAYADQIEAEMMQVSGVNEYQRGGGGDIRRTATEAAMIQDAANARAADKLAAVERFIAGIARSMLELNRQYMTGEAVARVIGAKGLPIWVPYTQEDIDVDADFVVEGGSTAPKNEAFRQNQAMQLIQALGPMVGQVIDPAKLAKFVLEAHGITDAESFLMQQNPMGLPPGLNEDAPPSPDQMPPDMQAEMEAMMGGGEPPPEEAESAIGGIDPAQAAQLMGQVGLRPGGGE